ncbi:MAG: hypothetical protein CMG66_06605 [Candidatus Marinimicrobia bacterium]|nr:hypothetical protein [Candidatus Neomarinimicrobiota bacterium]|tara:strand:- start:35423 stop:36850 length:1428 start_codon:yes stop_codon:yes gene_type:complete
MIPVLTKEEAYKLDRKTIESGYLSQEKLMDNAGKAIAQFFCEKIDNSFNQKVVIVCGKGNNGADGVIAHSYLKKYNIYSKIIFTEKKYTHIKLIKKYKILKNDYSIYSDKTQLDEYDWIIDGIFGIGLSRDVGEKYQKIFNSINKKKNILSIDISSGLFTDNAYSKYFINSKYVLTFGYPKLSHYLNPNNSLRILDIGFKEKVKMEIQLICKVDVVNILKDFLLKSPVHKYSKGYTCISAGSNKYPGAAILSSMAAFKSGSSYVNLHFQGSESIKECIKSQYPDIVLNQAYPIGDFCLFGPGYSSEEDDKEIWSCLDRYRSIVCDAGILRKADNINYFPFNSILTPHIGEYNKLFNVKNPLDLSCFIKIQNIIKDRIVILKSFNVFIITNDRIYIIDKGPSLLATAGTGDVLSGILVSLLSQGYSKLEASILGVYLHAEAANYYMNNISKYGMTASNLIDCIPFAFNKLRLDIAN